MLAADVAQILRLGETISDRDLTDPKETKLAEVPSILTDRLELVSLSIECLRAMFAADIARAQASGGFRVPRDCSLLGRPHLERRVAMIIADAAQHPWMDRAIVRKDDNLMIGYISFHHKAPDPDLLEYSACAVELGYGIDSAFRRKGYARESALAMMAWANRQGVSTFLLSIGPQNIPSLRMAESMGFRKVGERMDEVDGREYVYVVGISDLRRPVN